jgi:hypothetical protein
LSNFVTKTFYKIKNKAETTEKGNEKLTEFLRKTVEIFNRKIIPTCEGILLETGKAIGYYKSYVVKFSGITRIFPYLVLSSEAADCRLDEKLDNSGI